MTGTRTWASRIRDLSLLPLPDGSALVVACDSVGGIGPKPADTVTADPYTVGYFALRTPLLEILAVGAVPRLIINNLCFENGPAADEMIRAMVDVAGELDLGPEAVTGSTEDNVPTITTGIGVTVMGFLDVSHLRAGASRAGDLVVCLGLPRSAPAFTLTPTDPPMPTISDIVEALDVAGVHEVLPVGSRGVAAELAALAGTAGLGHHLTGRHQLQDSGFDAYASGGPASCVLVSAVPAALAGLRAMRADLPVTVVGELFAAPTS